MRLPWWLMWCNLSKNGGAGKHVACKHHGILPQHTVWVNLTGTLLTWVKIQNETNMDSYIWHMHNNWQKCHKRNIWCNIRNMFMQWVYEQGQMVLWSSVQQCHLWSLKCLRLFSHLSVSFGNLFTWHHGAWQRCCLHPVGSSSWSAG